MRRVMVPILLAASCLAAGCSTGGQDTVVVDTTPPPDTAPLPTSTSSTVPGTTLPLVTVTNPGTTTVVPGELPVEVPSGTLVFEQQIPVGDVIDGPLIVRLDDLVLTADAWGGRQLRVSNTEGLRPGDPVVITGDGYPPGTRLVAGQCSKLDPLEIDVASDCSTSNFAQVVVAADGSFAFVVYVSQQAGGVDCFVSRCVVGAAPIVGDGFLELGLDDAVGAEISFAR